MFSYDHSNPLVSNKAAVAEARMKAGAAATADKKAEQKALVQMYGMDFDEGHADLMQIRGDGTEAE